MLQRILLRDFAIVREVEIEFEAGFTALSGETGAGKSILLDALALALGGRADAGSVREGASRAEVHASFAIDAALQAWLAEHELTGDAGEVVLRRIVEADGRSRAFINGTPTTAAQLRTLGEQLVDIHGQHAAQSMLRGSGQRELLDSLGGLSGRLRELALLYAAWRSAQAEMQEAQRNEHALAAERERIAWQLEEFERLKPQPGEWEQLNETQHRLSHAAALIETTRGLADALAEDDDALGARLYQFIAKLKPLAQIDARLSECVQMLENAQIQIEEAASSLAAYAQRIDLDPGRLAEVDERVGALFAAARKLRIAPEALPEHWQALEQSARALAQAGDLAALAAREKAAHTAYLAQAQALSAERQRVARALVEGVTRHLQQLGMAGARFEIEMHATEASASGVDRVEFLIAGHAGSTPRPLAKVASGGELSRVGLAIAVQAAAANPVPTLIFDEADAGVGGAVAEVIGQLMRSLGETRQVFCVTHLPQVAARAHHHFTVQKRTARGHTESRVQRLSSTERIEEIARMLGGLEITETTRRHAQELLG
jgi:DNA repair protein RecN (Recombination protein N)